LRLGLIEASENRIGNLSDEVLLLCYAYNPMTGKYGFAIMRTLQAGGVLTLLVLGSYIVINLVRERRATRRPAGDVSRGTVVAPPGVAMNAGISGGKV
jgi:protein SCO1/2